MSVHIGYVCADPGIPVFGSKGASVHVQEVIRVLLGAGHTVHLVCRRTGDQVPDDLAVAQAEGRLTVDARERISGGDIADRERRLIDGDADVVAALIAAAKTRAFHLVYERYSLFSTAGTSYATAHRIPSILEVNSPLPLEQTRHRGLVHAPEAQRIARQVISAATATVCVSQPVAEWARRVAPHSHLVVEPNGVDPTRFLPPAEHTQRPFTVGFVGTLKPWHGTDTLVQAFPQVRRQVPGAELLIVGDGPQAEHLQAQATELGIGEAVTFTGPTAPADIPAHLHRMDVATAPYPAGTPDGEADRQEAYFSPLKVVEYMAAARPIVASAVGQIPELLLADDDAAPAGVLIPGSDAGALATALLELAGDQPARAQLGRAARRRVLRTRTWTQVVARCLAAAGIALLPATTSGEVA